MENDLMSLIDAERSRLKGEIRLLTKERDGARKKILAFVVDDLRQAAQAHLKSAQIAGKRIERKHLTQTADVLLERAAFYESLSAAT